MWKQHKASIATFPHLDRLKSSQLPKPLTQIELLECRTVLSVLDSLVMVPQTYEVTSSAPLNNTVTI